MKTISIRDDVYNKLVSMKEDGESFSDVIEKLLKRERFNIEEYFGVLRESSVLDEIMEYSRKARKSARMRI
ncbi:antitoxin VapB family protein [Archaeoglobus veneficus]|uniref:Putative antitoxin Arcve_0404 n=1 Tax=Archaeoglobus veneficus (strain DSM 11195 / SNP6) TaxID=693661 RepID=F2KPT0_ARCVS|nr:antitoxin VapB family protein [Archaeoglobus veneficus]AEA46437.1 UPF0330 protein [Archaeoglobus veneficus SNP6]